MDFISLPVTSGFTSATSVIIIVSQLKGLLGLKFSAANLVDTLIKIFENLGNVNVPNMSMGIASIIILLSLRVSIFMINTLIFKKNGIDNLQFKFNS